MALANATLITVTATYTRLDGRAASGQVFFSSNQVLVNSTSGEIVPPVDFVATLDANGAISIDLPATDDPDYEPQGWTYTVTEDTDGGDRPPFGLSVPADGGAIDLADVAPPGPTESLSSDEYTLLSTFTSHRSAWGGDPPAGSADDLLGLDANNVPKVIPSETYQKAFDLVRDITHPDYGAVDGGDNTQAIRDAIAALDPANGGPGGFVWLSDILSGVTGQITQPDGVALLGAGMDATTLRADAAISAVLVLAGSLETASGFTVDGNSNATNGIVAQDAARTTVSYVQSKHATSANWLIDETWDAASGNNVLLAFEHCLAEGGGTVTSNGWLVATGQVNANGILWHHSHSHSHTGSGLVMRGDGNRTEGGTWVNNGAYGIDAAAGQGHRFIHPWMEGNTTAGIVFSGAVRCEVNELPVSGMQAVDWASSNPGNISREVNNAGTEGGMVYRGGLFPQLADDAHLPGDGVNTFPRGYSAFLDVAGNFPAGAGGVVETFCRGQEGWQRNWTDGSNAVRERVNTDGATWQPWDALLRDDRPLEIGAGGFETHDAAAIVSCGNGRWGAWALDDASTERLTGLVDIPETWATFNLEVWHTTTTGNQGNAVAYAGVRQLVSGGALGTDDEVSGFVSVAAVGTANTMGVTTLISGATATNGPTKVRIQRSGGDANDDLTGDWLLLAVVLRKAS